jgi:hypothetical protein
LVSAEVVSTSSIVSTFHSNLLNHFFPSDGQKPIIDKFDKAFPVHNKDKREQAIDILDENFDKYSIARLIVGSPSGINRDAFSRLIMDTGKESLGKNEFVFKCDQTLLEKNEVTSLGKYGNWFEAITTLMTLGNKRDGYWNIDKIHFLGFALFVFTIYVKQLELIQVDSMASKHNFGVPTICLLFHTGSN